MTETQAELQAILTEKSTAENTIHKLQSQVDTLRTYTGTLENKALAHKQQLDECKTSLHEKVCGVCIGVCVSVQYSV